MTKSKFRTKIPFSKAGLVCSGGATKAAAFHIGVCLALKDKGFSFVGGRSETPSDINACPFPQPRYHPHQIATYVGSSAGALIVTMLASGVGIESLINSFSRDTNFKIPGSHRDIPRIHYSDILTISWPKPTAIFKSFQKTSIFSRTVESMVTRNLRVPGFFSTRGLVDYLEKHILPTNRF